MTEEDRHFRNDQHLAAFCFRFPIGVLEKTANLGKFLRHEALEMPFPLVSVLDSRVPGGALPANGIAH